MRGGFIFEHKSSVMAISLANQNARNEEQASTSAEPNPTAASKLVQKLFNLLRELLTKFDFF